MSAQSPRSPCSSRQWTKSGDLLVVTIKRATAWNWVPMMVLRIFLISVTLD
jgi:hypothetical protein